MKINKITLKGIRNIKSCEIELGKITALVAFNNYGKSNVLEAIRFAHLFLTAPPSIKKNAMGNQKFIPINGLTAENDFQFEIEYVDQINGKIYYINYCYTFIWEKENDLGQKIVSETLKYKLENDSQYSSYILREYTKGRYKPSQTGRVNKAISIGDSELLINKLSNYDDLFFLDVLKSLHALKFTYNSFYDATDAFGFVPFTIAIDAIDNEELEFNQFNDINKLFYNLKEKYNDKYELIKNTFLEIFPQVEFIEPYGQPIDDDFVNKNSKIPYVIKDTRYFIRVKEKQNNQPFLFEHLSKGTQRVFVTLVSAVLSSINKTSIIGFEELENCIHPKLFQRLLDVLFQLVEDTSIIITSHSPYMLQYLPLDNIYLGIPNLKMLAEFKKIKASRQKSIIREASQEGITTGEYLFNILEDCEEDEDLISDFFGGKNE